MNQDGKWEKYFKTLLGRMGKRMVWGERRTREDEEIGKEKINRIIRSLKKKKTMEIDGIPNEV